ncbi:MAG: SdiA-regulated domain-containing protein [Rhodocyclaceae bacterium]
MKRIHCLVALAALAGSAAHAANSIDLSSYTVTGNYALDTLGTLGLEASAVTYARDRNALFFVGDEGGGVVEVSLTGQTLSSMSFSGWPAATRHNDAEGLTYLGGGVLVVAEERLQDAFRFSYVAGGSVSLADAPWASISDYAYANNGIEGISYDPRDGSFVSVKQDSPMEVRAGTLSFAAGGGISTMTPLFDANQLGLSSLSDVQTLSPIDALAGTAAADNLLVLSLGSQTLLEIDRAGNTLSHFDLSGVTSQAIEGVTVDELGRIYLVAEDSGTPNSRLFVLTPVPEPETWAMMLVGLAGLGVRLRRRA